MAVVLPLSGWVTGSAAQRKADLVELLNRAQCSRADDQRGLLTKDQLEIPQFLQMEAQNEKQTSCDQTQEEDCFL